MKKQNRFKILFRKYIRNEYTQSELNEFFELLKEMPEDSEVFQMDFIDDELHKVGSEQLNPDTAQKILDKVNANKIAPKEKRKFHFYKIAAIFIGIVLGGTFLWFMENDVLESEFDENHVVLQTANGRKEILNDKDQHAIVSDEGDTIGLKKGGEIKYFKESRELVYNTLYVPNGEKIELSLADGSQIYLNSGSSIRYPLSFKHSKKRMIELKGEAFFEVAKDSSRPFIVNSSGLNVEVLGTSFNFNTYAENLTRDVVLVEGLVALYEDGEQYQGESVQLLRPGYKASFSKGSVLNMMEVDTDLYTSWRYGKLIYRNKSLAQIFNSLERNFNVKIENRNTELSSKIVNANFGTESFQNIMAYLNNLYEFKYTIDDDLIIIE